MVNLQSGAILYTRIAGKEVKKMDSKSIRGQILNIIKNLQEQRDILHKMTSSLEVFSRNIVEINETRANLYKAS